MPRNLTLVSLKNAARWVPTFLVWWYQELEAALTDVSDRLGLQWGRVVRLEPSGGSVEVTYLRGARVERTERLPLSSSPEDPTSVHTWSVLPRRVSVAIPSGWTLRVPLEFPIGAESHLRSAIALKLAQISPIPLSEIYWTFEKLEERADTVAVSVIIVRRGAVNEVLAGLARRGVRTSWLTVHPADSSCLPFDTSARTFLPRVIHQNLNYGLVVLFAVVLCGVAWGWHYRIARQNLALEQAYAAVKASAARDLDRRQLIERDKRLLRQLSALEVPSPSAVFLSVLEESLPAPIWLQTMDAVGREAHFTLYVPPRAEVAKLLLESPAIQSVTENSRISLGVGITEERVELLVVLTDPPPQA